jgi:predicted MPP superfamily phosphohydrolase
MLASLATEMLSHLHYGNISNLLLIAGYSSLPFLLYVFLLVLLRDILLGMNRLLKFVSADVLRSTKVRTMTVWVLVLLPLMVVVYGRLHYTTLEVNRYHIQIPKQSSIMQHLKVAVASDFHIKSWTDIGFMKRFVDVVNSENVDLLLLPGDLLEGDRQNEQLPEFEKIFHAIKTTYGVFASMGNHESYRGGMAEGFFQASSIVVLRDTAVVINNAFTLVGRNDGHANNRRTVEELMRTVPGNLPVIVLDHRPTDIEQISRTGATMLVSGHTHYGQLWPLDLVTELIYDVSWGYKKIRNTHVFVTSGVQLWGPPVRTTGDSEIMLIDVDFVP